MLIYIHIHSTCVSLILELSVRISLRYFHRVLIRKEFCKGVTRHYLRGLKENLEYTNGDNLCNSLIHKRDLWWVPKRNSPLLNYHFHLHCKNMHAIVEIVKKLVSTKFNCIF